MKKFVFTQNGYDDFAKELASLHEERKAAVKDLQQAREMGDLSENGFYKAAKSRLSHIDSRIMYLDHMLKFAQIVDKNDTQTIAVGNTVEIDMQGEIVTYSIVGELEANSLEHKISLHSPLGKALEGKKPGEEFTLHIGQNKRSGKILVVT